MIALLALLAIQSSPPGPRAPAATPVQAEAVPSAAASALAPGETFSQRLDRDRRIRFDSSSLLRARAELRDGPGGPLLEPALIVLGAAGDREDVATLLARAREASPSVQRVAILALGEARALGVPALRELLGAGLPEDSPLAEPLLLSLLRGGQKPERDLVLAAAEDPASPWHPAARSLAREARSRDPAAGSPLLELLLRLRWEAARRYGLVDGRPWSELVLESRLADRRFVARVVLEAAVRPGSPSLSSSPSLPDHLLEIALADGPPERLGPVAGGIPEVLGTLVEEGVWAPAGEEEWRAILGSIEDHGLESRALGLLRAALRFPALEREAGLLLLRGGGDPPPVWFARRLGPEGADRIEVAEALGASGDPGRVTDLLRLLEPEQRGTLYATCLVGLSRLGHAPARKRLDEALAGPTGPLFVDLVEALARVPRALSMVGRLETAARRADLPADTRLRAELALASAGRVPEHSALRTWLARNPDDPRRIFAVRALSQGSGPADLQLLRELFPEGEDVELDVELALALLRYREPAAVGLLRRAVWTAERNVALVAMGLLHEALGPRALQDELEVPPRGATEADLRRLGFGIGRFGGLGALESLARRRTSSDPALQGAYLGFLSARTH